MRFFISVFFLLSCSLAQAEILLQVGSAKVHWVDTANGSHTQFASCGHRGLAYDRVNSRVNNRLFGVKCEGDPYKPNSLYEIDMETGVATVIGTINIPGYSAVCVGILPSIGKRRGTDRNGYEYS